jgi:hypothetical protein
VIEKGRAGEDRDQREKRALRGGEDIVWVTVLGPDYTATLVEVIEYLNEYAADVGIDDSDIEVDDKKKPKVASPSMAKMAASLNDHENAAEIRDIGYGNKKETNPNSDEAKKRALLDNLLDYQASRGFKELSPERRKSYYAQVSHAQKNYDEAVATRLNYEQKEDVVRKPDDFATCYARRTNDNSELSARRIGS